MIIPAFSSNNIPIVFSVSEAYVPYLAVAVNSLLLHASPVNRYDLIVLHEEIPIQMQHDLHDLVNKYPQAHLRFVIVPDEIRKKCNTLKELTCNSSSQICYRFPSLVFYRLFLGDLFPAYKKMIHLGCDISLYADIAELYETKLGKHALAAVPDAFILNEEHKKALYAPFNVPAPSAYFNSDVQLINLDLYRQHRVSEHIIELLVQYPFTLIEQDALNVLFDGQWVRLGQEWNFFLPRVPILDGECYAGIKDDDKQEGTRIESNESWKLIHFVGTKPWTLDEGNLMPLTPLWWKSALEVPGYEDYFLALLKSLTENLKKDIKRQKCHSLFSLPKLRARRREKIKRFQRTFDYYTEMLHALER